jgi:hypothetical protein
MPSVGTNTAACGLYTDVRLLKQSLFRNWGRVLISVEVDKADLREIAVAGYPDAAATDREAWSKAVSLFLSDDVKFTASSAYIRLDTMFTVNASTVALKKKDTAPCKVVNRRMALLVI